MSDFCFKNCLFFSPENFQIQYYQIISRIVAAKILFCWISQNCFYINRKYNQKLQPNLKSVYYINIIKSRIFLVSVYIEIKKIFVLLFVIICSIFIRIILKQFFEFYNIKLIFNNIIIDIDYSLYIICNYLVIFFLKKNLFSI